MIPLKDDEVHVYLLPVDVELHPTRLSTRTAILSASERERCAGFRRPGDRDLCLFSGIATREVLTRYGACAPADWVFGRTRHGKPAIDLPADHRWLRFNRSHTAGMVAVAVSRERDVGVDVEASDGPGIDAAVIRDCYSPDESRWLASLTGSDAGPAALRLWTLKEAYLKAVGRGHSAPASAVSFALGSGDRPRARFGEGIDDDPADWDFRLLPAGDRHVAAVAARRGGSSLDFRVIERTFAGATPAA